MNQTSQMNKDLKMKLKTKFHDNLVKLKHKKGSFFTSNRIACHKISNKKHLDFSMQLLKESAQVGHKSLNISKSKSWHPLMSNYLVGIRNNTVIVDSNQTFQYLLNAFFIIAILLKNKGRLLIINTNPDFFKIFKNISSFSLNPINNSVKLKNKVNKFSDTDLISDINLRISNAFNKDAFICNSSLISYCNHKWIGGTLTNYKQISKSALIFAKFSQRFENFLIKNNIYFPQYKKMKKQFQGIITKTSQKKEKRAISGLRLKTSPDFILVINPNENRNVIHEAICLNIPVIAFTDSNSNLVGITYPIPINSNSIHFIYFFLNWIFKIMCK